MTQHHPGRSAEAPAPRRPAGSARPLLRAISWTGAVTSILCLIGGIAGLATVETLGPLPDNDWAGIGLALFITAALLPFVTWLTHLAISLWVDDNQRWAPPRYGQPATALACAAYLMLAAGLLTLVALPLLYALTPDPKIDPGDTAIVVILALIFGSITIAAIAGGIAIAGRIGIPLGILLGIGFPITTYGIYTHTDPATWGGAALLAASTIGYIMLGQRRSQR